MRESAVSPASYPPGLDRTTHVLITPDNSHANDRPWCNSWCNSLTAPLRQPHLLGHPACRRALAGFPHRVLEPFAERSLARQLRDLLGLHPAIRTAQPIQLDHDCRPVLKTRQITDLPFANFGDLAHAPPTTGANQLPLTRFAAHP